MQNRCSFVFVFIWKFLLTYFVESKWCFRIFVLDSVAWVLGIYIECRYSEIGITITPKQKVLLNRKPQSMSNYCRTYVERMQIIPHSAVIYTYLYRLRRI